MKWEPERAVKAGRAMSNMTQAELADRLSIVTGEKWSRGMVAALESGRKTFDVETLRVLSIIQALPLSFYVDGVMQGHSHNPDGAAHRIAS